MVQRRTVIRALAGLAVGATGLASARRSAAAIGTLGLRAVTAADAPFVQAIINMCVRDDGAFHGKCGDWSREWADGFVIRSPQSVILTVGVLPVGFQEVPTMRPALPPLPAEATEAEQTRYALRQANRRRFNLTAAGVRTDVLAAAEAVAMFRRTLYYGFRAARRQGFETAEGYFPWEQHPNMPRRWTDYPGCVLMEAPSISSEDGRRVYWLRWNLDQAIAALAAEGAGVEALDVA